MKRDEFWAWEDGDLVRLAQGGNAKARNALYMRYQALIARCRGKALREMRFGGSGPLEAEDLEGEGFLVFCELVEDWRPGGASFEVYLTAKMGWHLMHSVRATLKTRSRVKLLRIDSHDALQVVGSDGTDDLTIEDVRWWQERTAGLTERQKEALELRYMGNLSSREIALVKGVSTRTVRRDLRAGRNAVRREAGSEVDNEASGAG